MFTATDIYELILSRKSLIVHTMNCMYCWKDPLYEHDYTNKSQLFRVHCVETESSTTDERIYLVKKVATAGLHVKLRRVSRSV